jgi:hypothetical protein
MSVSSCKHIFPYQLSPETFGYTLVKREVPQRREYLEQIKSLILSCEEDGRSSILDRGRDCSVQAETEICPATYKMGTGSSF